MTGALVQVIPWHSLQVEAQSKPAFLQEQLFPHGPLQPQRITLSRSGGPPSVSVIIAVQLPTPISAGLCLHHPVVSKFESDDKLEVHDKCCPGRWWKKGWINFWTISCNHPIIFLFSDLL